MKRFEGVTLIVDGEIMHIIPEDGETQDLEILNNEYLCSTKLNEEKQWE